MSSTSPRHPVVSGSAGPEREPFPFALTLLVVASVTFVAAYALTPISEVLGFPTPAAPGVAAITHEVTPRMFRESAVRSATPAPSFSAEGSDGIIHALEDTPSAGPLVLVFIKDGCPCSDAAQTYFDRLQASYAGAATFLGVIGSDAATARGWAERHRAGFPVLADPDLKIIRAYGAVNSAYVALVDGGTLVQLWPGYSASILEEMDKRIAELAGLDAHGIETSDAPELSYSGCPFKIDL